MLDYIEVHYFGTLILTAVVVFFTTWLAWLFSVGRFKHVPESHGISFELRDLIINVIDDFRHLLALLLISIFAFALAYAMYLATTLDDLTISIQLVMSSLGGLVGSIVGYYFGESAVKRAYKIKNARKGIAQDVSNASQNVSNVIESRN